MGGLPTVASSCAKCSFFCLPSQLSSGKRCARWACAPGRMAPWAPALLFAVFCQGIARDYLVVRCSGKQHSARESTS